MKDLLTRIKRILRDRRIRKHLTRLVSLVAAVVVFMTTYALVLPAITMEGQAKCGMEAHQHDDSCYEEILICDIPESDGHHHDDSCYKVSQELVCNQEEHQHSDACYDEEGNLICELPEHTHGKDCYEEKRELVCEIPESEGHHHDASCYKKVLTCGKEAHTHSEACYQDNGEIAEQDAASGNAANPAASENTGADSSAGDTDSELTDADNAENAETILQEQEQEQEPEQEAMVPELDPLDFRTILNKKTGVYYYHVKPEETVEDSSQITDWTRAKDNNSNGDDSTELTSDDLIRVYLSYTIPGGSLNTTNPTARYRLPGSIRLSDNQIKAINKAENGISRQYDDKDKHDEALGAEAIEGTRRPDQDIDDYLEKNGQEYISATVKAENVFNDETGEYEGQDLIFTFAPYTVEKNQDIYDAAGEKTKSGEKVHGWFTFDLTTDQVEWGEPTITRTETGEADEKTEDENTEAENADADNTDADNTEAEKAEADNTTEQEGEKTLTETKEVSEADESPNTLETAENAEQEAIQANETSATQETKSVDNKEPTTVIERSERSADIVFVKEGHDVDNNPIEKIATTLKLVEETKVEESTSNDVDPSGDNTTSDFSEGTLEASGDGYKITLDYTAEAQIPENASLSVREITAETDPEAYKACLEQAGEKMASKDSDDVGGKSAAIDENSSRFFDIEIVVNETDENGKEISRKIEPKAEVSVNIQIVDSSAKTSDDSAENTSEQDNTSGSEPQRTQEPTVLHFTDDGVEKLESKIVDDGNAASGSKAGGSEKNDSEDTKSAGEDNASTEVQFTTDSFSIYGVVYTVDFHWEVDGKEFEFSIKGGSTISLKDLVQILHVVEDDKTTEDIEPDRFISEIKTVEFTNESLICVVPVTEKTTAGELIEKLNLEVSYAGDVSEADVEEFNKKEFTVPDWALITLQPFLTEEWLTITLTNGEVFRIKVTDDISDKEPGNMTVLNTEDTRAQGIKMWLFDYDLDGSLDNQDNKSNTDNNKQDGINAESDFKFLGWGAGTENNNATTINDFTGLDDGNGNNHIRALQGIVKNELEEGYPVLNNGQSLAYLFDPTAGTDDRLVYGGTTKESGNVTGLFEKSNGYYIYDSDEHYAELGSNGTDITVYTSTLAQTKKNGANHTPVRAVGFFPFNTYSDAYNKKYDWDNNNYGNYGTMYLNPDGTNGKSGLNHHLGVAMEMDFVIPKDGKDEDGDPIKFNFSGDDDMWVFIDDQLVLDIGGLHQPVDGTIDFSTGVATITGKATTNTSSDNTGSNAIATVEGAIDPRGNDFQFYSALNMPNGGDGKTHTMKIFYLERGGCDSNCMISFNLPLVKGKADVKVAKYDQSSNPVKPLKGVKFGLYSDPFCTDLIEEIPSDENGLLLFENLAIKNDSQKYYLKETAALPGYKPSEDIYTLEVAEDSSGSYYFKVMKNGQEIETIGQEPAVPVIYNEPVEPIDLTVEKKWQDQSGNDIQAINGMSATFQVKRYFRYEGEEEVPDPSQPVTFKVYRYKGNSTEQVGTDYTFKGGTAVTVNWGYSNGYYGNNYSGIMNYKESISGTVKSKPSAKDPVTVTLPNSGEAAIYIRDENLNTQWGDGVINITVDGTPFAPSTIIRPISTDWAEDTEYHGPTLTLPDDKIDDVHPWTGKFEDLPLFEQKGDLTYMYKYYIVETAKTPTNSTLTYVDGSGNVISDPSTLQTDTDGTQTIINKVDTGALYVHKSVTFSGHAPENNEQKEILAGTYQFKIYTNQNCSDNCAIKDGEEDKVLSITIGNDGVAQNSETITLPVGTYWIKEIVSDDAMILPVGANPREVTITAGNTTSSPKEVDVTNDCDYNEEDDDITVDIVKQFTGLTNQNQIPEGYQGVLSFKLKNGTTVSVPLTGETYQHSSGVHVKVTKSEDGLTWNWHVYRIPKDSTDFKIHEENYNNPDYELAVTINGEPVDNPEADTSLNMTAPTATFTPVDQSRITAESSLRKYYVGDDYILLVSVNPHGTVVLSNTSLNYLARTAITDAVQTGELSGSFSTPVRFFSTEQHQTVIRLDNKRTITVTKENGRYIVQLPPNTNSQAVGYSVKYDNQDAINNAEIVNDYTGKDVPFELIKVDKDTMDLENKKFLEGAQFTITQLDEAGRGDYKLDPESTATPKDLYYQETITTNNVGWAKSSDLKTGYYEIKESKAPDGYNMISEPIYIKVQGGVLKRISKTENDPATTEIDESLVVNWPDNTDNTGIIRFTPARKAIAADPENGIEAQAAANASFLIGNEPGAALPSTGGSGTKWIYQLGTVITLLAAGCMCLRRFRH